MTTDTEAPRAAFEDYINPEGDVALHWQPAGYYAGGGLQRSWLDFQSGYWAGHAAAKAETADAGGPVAFAHFAENGNIRLWAPERPRDLDGNIAQPLYTADQLAAAVAAERERCIGIIESHHIPVGNSAAGEMECEWTYDALETIRDTIREGAKGAPS